MEFASQLEVRSTFLMGDAMVKLDRLLNDLLLIPKDGESKGSAALREGKRLKKLGRPSPPISE